MGLYLTIFDGDVEIDGLEVGQYADFDTFRSHVTNNLEGGILGSKYPTLMLHSDCRGEWSPEDCKKLQLELDSIAEKFSHLPPIEIEKGWKTLVVKSFRLQLNNLYDCFFDVDGEPLLERLKHLSSLSQKRGLPILFQ